MNSLFQCSFSDPFRSELELANEGGLALPVHSGLIARRGTAGRAGADRRLQSAERSWR